MQGRIVARVLGAVVVGVGLVLSAIGILVVPVVALGGTAFAVLVGVVAATSSAGTRTGARAAAAAAAGWLVVVGLVVLMGPASGIVLLAVVAAVLVAWLWRRPGTARPTVITHLPAVPMPTPPLVHAGLSTAELCVAWQHSYVAMLDVPAGPHRCELVRIREGLLDELERRDHDGFARWLEAGARAGSDPSRFLKADRPVSGG